MATTTEVLSKVGFEKSKIGHGDKEVGYQINETSLGGLLGSMCVCFSVMGLMVVMLVYDVHFEKKTLHRQLRVEEHHSAAKLAQVQMELWSQYRDDIKESHEAQKLLKDLDASYGSLQGKLKAAVDETSAELGLNPVKASKFAEKIVHLVADTQLESVKHVKHLVDHLVAVGKKSVKLEKLVDKQIQKELKEEKQLMKEDMKEGIDVGSHEKHQVPSAQGNTETPEKKPSSDAKTADEMDDPLKDLLEGFFFTLKDFDAEFKQSVRDKMQPGNTVYDQVEALHKKILSSMNGQDEMSEEEMNTELLKIDLASVGAGLGGGRVLPPADIIEELSMIPKLPFKQLTALETAWRKGEKDSAIVFEELSELHAKGVVPGGWLQQGVNEEEKIEEMEEERLEEMEGKDED